MLAFSSMKDIRSSVLKGRSSVEIEESLVITFIRKKGPSVGLFKSFAPPLMGTGKRPFFVSEKLTFDNGFGKRPAIDRDQRFMRAGTDGVNQTGNEFFPGAAFLLGQNGCLAIGDPASQVHQVGHFRAFKNDLLMGKPFFMELLPEYFVFANEGLPLCNPLNKEQQFFQIDGLGDIVHGPHLHVVHGRFDGADKGFSLVELLSPCPTNWKLSPKDAWKWVNEEMVKTYPLGVIKDITGYEDKK